MLYDVTRWNPQNIANVFYETTYRNINYFFLTYTVVKPLKEKLHGNLHLWNTEDSILRNLQKVLEVDFPSPSSTQKQVTKQSENANFNLEHYYNIFWSGHITEKSYFLTDQVWYLADTLWYPPHYGYKIWNSNI